MADLEHFLAKYFVARTTLLKQELKAFGAFHQQFHTDDLPIAAHHLKKLDELAHTSEKIIRCSRVEGRGEAITARLDPTGQIVKLRYQLRRKKGEWFIDAIDQECPFCHGLNGNANCTICKGEGWHASAWNKASAPTGSATVPPSRPF